MEYGHIVAMIDTRLERLQAARGLLRSSDKAMVVEDPLQAAGARAVTTKKKVRRQITNKRKRRDELTASLFVPVPGSEANTPELSPKVEVAAAPIVTPNETAVVKQPAVAAPRKLMVVREREARVPRKKAAALVSALAGHALRGPVFIPAAQVPQVRPKVRVEDTPQRAESSPLTAELLAQRWIQNAGF